MIIYNVTVKIESDIQDDWLQWMRVTHIPDVLNTGYFKEAELRRVLVEHEDGDITYAIQYKARNMASIAEYQKSEAARLQAEHTERYKGKYVAFRTLMEEVETY